MGLLDVASGKSFWRGYDYFREGKVLRKEKVSNSIYRGTVAGSDQTTYEVTIDLQHPKRSVCGCPHADGTRRVCKHKVALYFSVFPEEADKAMKEAEEWESEEERRIQEENQEIEDYVYSLSLEQLREELIWRLTEEKERSRW